MSKAAYLENLRKEEKFTLDDMRNHAVFESARCCLYFLCSIGLSWLFVRLTSNIITGISIRGVNVFDPLLILFNLLCGGMFALNVIAMLLAQIGFVKDKIHLSNVRREIRIVECLDKQEFNVYWMKKQGNFRTIFDWF